MIYTYDFQCNFFSLFCYKWKNQIWLTDIALLAIFVDIWGFIFINLGDFNILCHSPAFGHFLCYHVMLYILSPIHIHGNALEFIFLSFLLHTLSSINLFTNISDHFLIDLFFIPNSLISSSFFCSLYLSYLYKFYKYRTVPYWPAHQGGLMLIYLADEGKN